MKIGLKDIIDLDYLIARDNSLDSRKEIKSRELEDRKIYSQCQGSCPTDMHLMLSWLRFRRDEKGLPLLPGMVFSSLYTCAVYIMIMSGFIIGISTVYSFLAYHGTQPVNVTSFTALFIVLPMIFILLAMVVVMQRLLRKNHSYPGSIVHTIVCSLFFNVLPKIIKKTGRLILNQDIEDVEYFMDFMHMKAREYKTLFLWPFFILTSVFAFSFSTGVLGGMFLKIAVSDMAFGWQSTLMTSSSSVHDLVSFTASPWSWFISETMSFPSLEQIEGSRIILKQGIHALATQDLVSWWPFLCLGILFYAVIPRGLLIIAGSLFQQRVLKNFNLTNPKFRQVIIRMKAPVMDVDIQETNRDHKIEKNPVKNELKTDSFTPRQNMITGRALLVLSKKVYSDETILNIRKSIEQHLFFNIKEIIGINFNFNFNDDAKALAKIKGNKADSVILVQEVWQPPIRELLYYITKLKAQLPRGIPLYILLTQDAGQEDLRVDKSDINFKVWEKTVFLLKDPGISVMGFL